MGFITLTGHSHTQCIVEGLISKGQPVHWGYLDDGKGTNPLVEQDGRLDLEAGIVAQLRTKAAQSDLCLSTIGGNAHTVIGLIATNPPFDFELPGLNAPLDRTARRVPYGTVRASLFRQLEDGDFRFVDATLRAMPEIRFHVQSPPPPQDNALCLSRIDPYFVAANPDIRIAAPWLRLKLWTLHSQIFEERFASMGIEVLPPPAEARTDEGFLRPEFVHDTSSTHANIAYGRLVADQILGLQR